MAALSRPDARPPRVGYFQLAITADGGVTIEFRTERNGDLIARVPLTREAADALAACLAPDHRAEMYRLATAGPDKVTH